MYFAIIHFNYANHVLYLQYTYIYILLPFTRSIRNSWIFFKCASALISVEQQPLFNKIKYAAWRQTVLTVRNFDFLQIFHFHFSISIKNHKLKCFQLLNLIVNYANRSIFVAKQFFQTNNILIRKLRDVNIKNRFKLKQS